MKSISEIIQECCVGVEYALNQEGDWFNVSVFVEGADVSTTTTFTLDTHNLEESLTYQLTQAVASLKQQAHVLKRGDVIREYKYGTFVESTIVTDVVTNERGQAVFVSETTDGAKINYMKHQSSLEVQGL